VRGVYLGQNCGLLQHGGSDVVAQKANFTLGGFMPCTRISSLCLLAVLALAGCSTDSADKTPATETAPAPVVASDGRCDSDLAKFAVGQTASSALLQQAQQRSGAQTARILRPGDIMTLEYRSERLNLNVDAQGVVSRVNCG
jgi:hypothetical protein